MDWTPGEFEDTAWAGPFDSRADILASLDESLRRAGLTRDDDLGELVSIPLARVGDQWWGGMPASLVAGPERFVIFLAFDPDNEWGAPIGYDVRAIEDREGRPHIGPAVRKVREATHPDDGKFDAALAEVARRAKRPVDDADDFEEIGIAP
ncbi:MAG: hypothetical protein AAGF12_40350 [Myxococcota bacterium]